MVGVKEKVEVTGRSKSGPWPPEGMDSNPPGSTRKGFLSTKVQYNTTEGALGLTGENSSSLAALASVVRKRSPSIHCKRLLRNIALLFTSMHAASSPAPLDVDAPISSHNSAPDTPASAPTTSQGAAGTGPSRKRKRGQATAAAHAASPAPSDPGNTAGNGVEYVSLRSDYTFVHSSQFVILTSRLVCSTSSKCCSRTYVRSRLRRL